MKYFSITHTHTHTYTQSLSHSLHPQRENFKKQTKKNSNIFTIIPETGAFFLIFAYPCFYKTELILCNVICYILIIIEKYSIIQTVMTSHVQER